MSDIFDEVSEDLRADQARLLLRRYGGLLILAMLLTLVGVGAYHVWADRQQQTANALAEKFLAAQKAAESRTPPKDLEQQFAAIASSGPIGYQVLAKLQMANLQWKAGQHESAVAIWSALSADPATPSDLKDLATLTRVQHQLDTADAKQLKADLVPLVQGTTRWRPLAAQLTALLDIRLGRTADATQIFRQLVRDEQAPTGIRQVAQAILIDLSLNAPPAPAEPPTANKAGTHG